MSNITQVHPDGSILHFQEKNHTYFFEDTPEELLISSTTFLKDFFPIFDTETISRKYAKKHGLNQKDVKRMWKDEGIETSKFGDKCHDYVDCLIYNKILPEIEDKKDSLYFGILNKEVKKLLRANEVIGSEYIIASKKLELAGAIDLILKGNSIITIVDWKIVKAIKRNNIYQTALKPIQYLDDCNYNKYSLQLNLYKYILIKADYFPEIVDYQMVIKHITEDGCVNFQVSDMTKEIEKMINYKKRLDKLF